MIPKNLIKVINNDTSFIYEELAVNTEVKILAKTIFTDIQNGDWSKTYQLQNNDIKIVNDNNSPAKYTHEKNLISLPNDRIYQNLLHELNHALSRIKMGREAKSDNEYQVYASIVSDKNNKNNLSPELILLIQVLYYLDPLERNARAQEMYYDLIQQGPGNVKQMMDRLYATNAWEHLNQIGTIVLSDKLKTEMLSKGFKDPQIRIANLKKAATTMKNKLKKVAVLCAKESNIIESAGKIGFNNYQEYSTNLISYKAYLGILKESKAISLNKKQLNLIDNTTEFTYSSHININMEKIWKANPPKI